MIRFSYLLLCIVFLGLICSCSEPSPIDTTDDGNSPRWSPDGSELFYRNGEEDEHIIRGLETELIEALANKDLDRFASLYADDATVFYPNTQPIMGKDALQEAWKEMFARPGFSLSMQAERSEVSRSADLAYAHGKYTLAFGDDSGTSATEKGNYIVIFRKQSDGQWKIIIDIATSDHPAEEDSTKQATDLPPHFSPDGKWIAYTSNDLGETEIYVLPVK